MFTYRDYYDMLTTITDSCQLLLRHDVDISLKKAAELAEREYKMSIGPATYFILMTSEFYNPFDEDNRRRIEQILDMGHNIGLHYDMSLLPKEDGDALQKITVQAFVLGHEFDREIVSATFHEPVMGRAPSRELMGAMQAMGLHDPYLTAKDYKYISDSGMNFREDPYQTLKYHTRLHLNIHPEWWAEKEGTFQERLHDLGLDKDADRKINKHIDHIKEYHKVVKSEN